MLEPILDRLPIKAERAHFEPDGTLPQRSRTRSCPRTASSSSARSSGPEPTSGSPSTATPTAASSSTTPASSSPATSSPRSSPSSMLSATRARRSSTTSAPPGQCPTPSRASAAGPSRRRVGHAFIKHRLRQENALFAGEVSGHYYFRDFYGVDTGVVPALVMLELVSRARRQALRARSRRCSADYHLSGEINTTVSDVPAASCRRSRSASAPPARAARSRTSTALSVELRRLALQRAPVEHRAAAAPQPRGTPRRQRWSAAATRCSPSSAA